MSERSGVPAAFTEWLNAKNNSSTPQTNRSEATTKIEIEKAEKEQTETESIIVKTQIAHTLTMESVRIDFPLKPYPAQLQMMSKIIHALNRSENALLESPTGSGKSLALLCAALAWKENEEKKISNELRAIQEEMARKMTEDEEVDQKENIECLSEKRTREDDPKEDQIKKPKYDDDDLFFDDDFQPNQILSNLMKADDLSSDYIPVKKEKAKLPPPKSKIPRIYVGSRTHKQLTQLISELKRNTQYRPKMTVLGSREQLCIHPKVSKSPNKNEECVSLLDKNSCSYFHKTKKLVSRPEFTTTEKIWDIEDMVNLGKVVRGCPYYASRTFFETAEIIFCPYNYILDPMIRNAMGINLGESIVILDEAHNMEDAARSAGSFELDDKALSMIKIELNQIVKGKYEEHAHGILEHLFDVLWDWITSPSNVYDIKEYERHIRVWSGQKIIERLKELNITTHTFQTQFVPAYQTAVSHAEAIRKESESSTVESKKKSEDGEPEVIVHRRKCLSNSSLNVVQGVFMIFGFLFREDRDYTDDYRMVTMKRIDRSGKIYNAKKGKGKSKHDSIWQHKLAFWCLNPGIIFQDMCEKTRSVVLTSGTLSPMESFATELDTKFPSKLEANHVIDPSQVWVSCLPTGPSGTYLRGIYTNIESLQYQDDVGEAIYQISETVPFGILCFLPSYNAMDKLLERWKLTGMKKQMESKKLVLSEPKGSDKKVFEKVINEFYDQIDRSANDLTEEKEGAIFFAVYRGKVSEGIDFTNEYCRAVVALGIPYPGMKDMEVQLKKEYNDKRRMKSKNNDLLSGREWYSIQAYRAINQALGRCIRHKNDWGAIILLEDRFQTQEAIKGLSKWIRGKVQVHHQFRDGMSSLKQFVQHRLSIQQKQSMAFVAKQEPDMTTDTEQECTTTVKAEQEPDTVIQTEAHVSKERTLDNQPPVPTDIDWKESNAKTTIKHETISLKKKAEPEKTDDILMDDLDALMRDIDDDLGCEQSELTQQTAGFFSKAIKDKNEPKPVLCKDCKHVLMTGNIECLKPVDNMHLNCVLYSTQNDTRMLELEDPASWKTSTLCLDVSNLPTESQVYMNKVDKLCYQKMKCNCSKPIGIMICGAISPDKKDYVGKVYFWEDAVTYEKERQKGWTRPFKEQETDEPWDTMISSQMTTMTDMFYNLP